MVVSVITLGGNLLMGFIVFPRRSIVWLMRLFWVQEIVGSSPAVLTTHLRQNSSIGRAMAS